MNDVRIPLTPGDYAPGRQVKSPEGDSYKINGRIVADGGNAFLLVSQPHGGVSGLVLESDVRDEFDSIAPEDEAPIDATTPQPDQTVGAPGAGTDGTGGTGSQE